MNPAPLYKIANWSAFYESKDSRRTAGPMKWIPVPTKTDGFGFGLLKQERNRTELLAAWYLMLGVAAKQTRELRGSLMRDGSPLTAEDLALMTGFPAKIFDDAFAFFTQPRQGWLVKDACGQTAASCARTTADCARTTASCAPHYITLQDSRVEDNRIDNSAEVSAPQPVSSASDSAQTDAEWLESLKSNPAYRGIDVAREHAKALVWAAENKKQMSRRRFVNWLNRAERPMGPQTAIPGNSRASLPEPDDWRAWIHENAPESVYARGGTHEGAAWATLDAITQEWITKQINSARNRRT